MRKLCALWLLMLAWISPVSAAEAPNPQELRTRVEDFLRRSIHLPSSHPIGVRISDEAEGPFQDLIRVEIQGVTPQALAPPLSPTRHFVTRDGRYLIQGFAGWPSAQTSAEETPEKQVLDFVGVPGAKILATRAWHPDFTLYVVAVSQRPQPRRIWLPKERTYLVEGDIFSLASSTREERVNQLALEDRATLGVKNAPVTLVMFEDVEHPWFTESWRERILKGYPGKLRVIFKHAPGTNEGWHVGGLKAANALECVRAQKPMAFWALRERLIKVRDRDQELDSDSVVKHANEFVKGEGLDADRFEACLESSEFQARITRDYQDAGVVAVPWAGFFLVNGRIMDVSDDWDRVIESELAALGIEVKPLHRRVDISGDAPFAKGPSSAPVTVVAYVRYGDPRTPKLMQQTLDVVKGYGDQVRLLVRQLPDLEDRASLRASLGALAAARLGRFWDMHARLVERSTDLFSWDDLTAIAKDLGMDHELFTRESRLDAVHRVREKHTQLARQDHILGAGPQVAVNGKGIGSGARGLPLKMRLGLEIDLVLNPEPAEEEEDVSQAPGA